MPPEVSEQVPEWQAFEELDQWFNVNDRSLAAYLTRQWRFRHGLVVFAAIFAVAPACIAVGVILGSVPTIIVGAALCPLTPVIASLIVKVDSTAALRRVMQRRKDP